jgi:hypothetical protein
VDVAEDDEAFKVVGGLPPGSSVEKRSRELGASSRCSGLLPSSRKLVFLCSGSGQQVERAKVLFAK